MPEFTEHLQQSMLPHIRGLGVYQGVEPVEVMAERAGIPQDRIIRLNGNENPYGPSPAVAEALADFPNFNHYPDPEQRQLREALSGYVGVDADRIIAGNGSDELIDMLFRMFIGPGDNIVNLTPTFGMYALGAEICGGQAVSVPRDENFEIDLESVKLAITPRTKAIVVCSPNNPTGNMPTEADVRALLDTGILVIVDEAYYEFSGQTLMPLLHEYPNIVVLRTFSKWAGLAGLRIGLGAMHPDLAGMMMSVKPPYNVNLAAEVALIASLKDMPALLDRVNAIVDERDRMTGLLEAIPTVKPYPSKANFILCQLPEGSGPRVFEGLCNRGIFLRHWSNSRLIDCIRTSVGLPEENDAVATALAELTGDSNG
jgi:histidinol-phosphate aminotransferase